MTEAAKYLKIVQWSDEDQCFIGTCPDLNYGGCHGDDEQAVFAEICQIAEESIELIREGGKPLPRPTTMEELEEMITTASKKIRVEDAQVAPEAVSK